MVRKANRKLNNRWIWLTAVILLVSVTATSICVADRFWGYAMDDSGALPLVPASVEEEDEGPVDSPARNTVFVDPKESGFEVSSDGQVWGAKTDVEIFRASYENGEYQVTVKSENGDSLIAPGTENSFIFKVKNTGETPLDYQVKVSAFFGPEGINIPIYGRICRYDGEWLAGDKDNFVDMEQMNGSHDESSLSAGRYAYYTLDWTWPYEQGDDALDTLLGNQAVNEDLTLTIRIETMATVNPDADLDEGIKAPSTGDNQSMVLWIALGAAALCLLAFLLYFKRKEQEEETEAEVQPGEEK